MRFKKHLLVFAFGSALSGGAIAAEQAFRDRGDEQSAQIAFATMLGGAVLAGSGLGLIAISGRRR